jgi:uncharacterized repeat protein (TIGR01451 family)
MSRCPSPDLSRTPASRCARRAPGGVVAGALLLALLAPGSAQAQYPADTAIYTANNSATLFVVTNRATGAQAAIATLAFATSALARDASTSRIYYVSSTGILGRVAYYNPVSGTNTVINSTGSGGDNIIRLTFNGGLMYAIGDVAHGSRLYTIDPTTGTYVNLGSVRIGSTVGQLLPNDGDIAFDPASGTLYAVANDPANNGGSFLFTINLVTRVATQLGPVNGGGNDLSALTFVSGVLYAGGAGELYTVNMTTGVGTLVASPAATFRDFATGPPVADLQLTMTASAGFTAGGNATYTLTARNNGPYRVTAVVSVVDTLPPGLSFTSATGTGWTCGALGQVVTCTRVGTVNSSTTLPDITLIAAITGSVAPSVTNVAVLSSSTMADQNFSNNRVAITSAVTVSSVSTTPDGATVSRLPSNATLYSQVFVVTNSGSVVDSYNLAATVAPAGVVTIVSVNGVNGSTGATGVIASLGTSSVTVVYTVASGAATGATATLTLTATSTVVGTVSDAGSLTVTVIRANLTMAKQPYRDDQTTLVTTGVSPGEYLQYKVTITNSGGAGAITVNVSDLVPGAVTYVANTPDAVGWTITAPPTATITASLAGTLAAGASRYFWIRVRVK